MKTNEAPEKLYVDFRDKAESTWRCAFTEKAKANDIEYTRTDAFIEKAVSFIRNCTTYDGLGYKAKCVNIEKFKKYMKGE
jgi:hypothetical protein